LGHLVRAFPNHMWSNMVNKASPRLLGECGGPGPSLVAIGHKSRSSDMAWRHVCPNPARPVLRFSERHNFVIRTLN
jgi:hypothetical protein